MNLLGSLLSNAINYTGEDQKVKIVITKKFDCAKIEVIDSGEGIAKEDIANVWDRYYRTKTHIRSQVGTGLGLSIASTIVKSHGGTIKASHNEPKGTVFTVKIPIK